MRYRQAGEKTPLKDYKEDRLCENCGEAFPPKRKDSKYCSPRCGSIAYYKKHGSAHISQPKPFCSREGCTKKVSGGLLKYCSDECREIVKRERVNAKGSATDMAMEFIRDPDNVPEIQKINRITMIGANSSVDAMKEVLAMKTLKLSPGQKLKIERVDYKENNDHKLWGR